MNTHKLFQKNKNDRKFFSLFGFNTDINNNDNQAITIINNNVSADIDLYVDNNYQGLDPDFLMFLSIGENSVNINNVTTSNETNYIYIESSYSTPIDTKIPGSYNFDNFLIKYDTNTNQSNIINNGCFTVFDDLDLQDMRLYTQVNNLSIMHSGYGYKLDSVFYFVGFDGSTDDIAEETVSVDLTLNQYTINITGGKNYRIGDIFTVYDGGGTGSSSITVTNVDIQTGAILETEFLLGDFHGITSEPTVIYAGAGYLGSGAQITINNNYSIHEVTSSLSGYYQNYEILHSKIDDQRYSVISPAKFDFSNDVTLDININKNNLILHSVKCLLPGNNITNDTNFLIRNNDQVYNASEYISINSNNLIKYPSRTSNRQTFKT